MPDGFHHIPVLKEEAIKFLLGGGDSRDDGASVGCAVCHRFIDATVGGGSDSGAVLAAAQANLVLGIDRDRTALEAASARLAGFHERFRPWHGPFSQMERA